MYSEEAQFFSGMENGQPNAHKEWRLLAKPFKPHHPKPVLLLATKGELCPSGSPIFLLIQGKRKADSS